MSYQTLTKASLDPALTQRTVAACMQEAFENASVADSDFAKTIKKNSADAAVMVWPIAIAGEAEYESALAAGNPNPGGDPAVITDGMILSAVQVNWPVDVT